MQCDIPDQVFVSWGQIVDSNAGISRYDLAKAVRAGAVTRHRFPGCRRAKYRREEIVRVFGLEGREAD